MSFTLPRLPQTLPNYGQAQIWWQQVVEKIESQETIQDQALADIQTALTAAFSRQPDVPPVTVQADYTGAVTAGQLPRNIAIKRYYNMTDVTASSAWSLTTLTGTITATIGAATGLLVVTALGTTATLQVTSVRSGVTLTSVVTVTKVLAPAPSGGSGGGTSASDSSFTSINAAAHVAISDELTVTAGSAGTVTLTAPLGVSTAAFAPNGAFAVFGKWQWYDGAVWVDLGTEVQSSPDTTVFFGDLGERYTEDGSISVPSSKTGLVAASSHKFRLMARNSTGTRTMTFYGTATAVGS